MEAGSELLAERLDRLELGDLLDPFVGDLGQLLGLDALDEHLEGDLFATVIAHALGKRVVVLDDGAGIRSHQLLIEPGYEAARADRVGEVVGGELIDLVAVDRRRQIDDGVVAVGHRVLGVFELGELVAETVDLLVDVLVGHLGRFDADFAPVIERNMVESRPQRDLDFDFDALIRVAHVLDRRSGGGTQIGLGEGIGHNARQGDVDGLGAEFVGADGGLDDFAGHLARAEALDLHVLGEPLGCLILGGFQGRILDLNGDDPFERTCLHDVGFHVAPQLVVM